MRQTRDTFLHLLSDNLIGVPVHNVRLDLNNPGSEKYEMNSVNVKFLDVNPLCVVGNTVVEIAIMSDNELDGLTWLKAVRDILTSAYYTPKLDYTNPSSPTAVGTNIYWDFNSTFKTVHSEFYCDMRCMLTLRHKIDS